MKKKLFVLVLAVLVIPPIALTGCRSKVEKAAEEQPNIEATATESTATLASQAPQPVVEPAQNVAAETIPPTAAAQQAVEKAAPAAGAAVQDRTRDIQTALKNAGFYTGALDGKAGPKTKKAIMEFQKAKGLKVDGKVGSKTWAEMEKYLLQQ